MNYMLRTISYYIHTYILHAVLLGLENTYMYQNPKSDHSFIHTYIHIVRIEQESSHIHTYIHTYIHKLKVLNIHTYTYLLSWLIYTYLPTLYTYIHKYIHTYSHTMYTYMHTYIHNV